MSFRVPILLALFLATPAEAADRTVGIGSFSRLRVEGGFDVRIVTGSPSARISGDRDSIEAVDLHVDGSTLVIRRSTNGIWTERPRGADAPIVVTIGVRGLEGVLVIGGARVAVARMAAPRIDLSVSGTGAIDLAAAQADQLNAQIVGAGSIAVAGRTGAARLTTTGAGTIDADKLDGGDLVVRLDGLGTTRARARYTATVTNNGLGTVAIAGAAKCTVRAPAGGPVTCGAAR